MSNCCDALPLLDRNYLLVQFIAVPDASLYPDFTTTEAIWNINEVWGEGSRAMRMLEFDSQARTSYAFCIAGSNYKPSCVANASFALCNPIHEWLGVSKGKLE